jgi:hypothetical protein
MALVISIIPRLFKCWPLIPTGSDESIVPFFLCLETLGHISSTAIPVRSLGIPRAEIINAAPTQWWFRLWPPSFLSWHFSKCSTEWLQLRQVSCERVVGRCATPSLFLFSFLTLRKSTLVCWGHAESQVHKFAIRDIVRGLLTRFILFSAYYVIGENSLHLDGYTSTMICSSHLTQDFHLEYG